MGYSFPSDESETVSLKHPKGPASRTGDNTPLFALETGTVPRHELPAGEMAPDLAYQIVHDELMLDGNARLNVATFVSTWMEPQAEKLMAECFDKNMIDKDEYPQTADLEMRCVSILSRLWNAPDTGDATGCSTTGSSEAAMLGGLALKRRWQKKRAAGGEPADKPNLVMGINVQVCWEKFANYWDVEMRLVPMEGNRLNLSAEEAVKLCDENTIGVVAILGSTFDGSYEPVQEICAALDVFQKDTGIDIPVHVDGASGAMIAPFVDPGLEWDFRLPRVASINTSGHKYGLVYPGVGWIVWRDAEALPEDLIFWVNYLGDNMPTFALNFSRPGSQVVAQYYNFLRLGFEGYRRVQTYARDVATHLSAQIAELGPFELLTRGDELPVFAFTLKDEVENYTVFDVSNALRERGWQLPAYTFPENRTDLRLARGRQAWVHARHGPHAHPRPRATAAAPGEAAGFRSRRSQRFGFRSLIGTEGETNVPLARLFGYAGHAGGASLHTRPLADRSEPPLPAWG
jgi:glutamate decarboxylase